MILIPEAKPLGGCKGAMFKVFKPVKRTSVLIIRGMKMESGIPHMIVLSARSGRRALKHRLEKLGYNLEIQDMEKTYERFLQMADQKKEVFDEDLHLLK